MKTNYKVTENAKRPASDEEACFYCRSPIGDYHKEDCVLVRKKVMIKMTVGYEVVVPACWTKEDVEYSRNDGTWCANNALYELKEMTEKNKTCMCHYANFEYIEDTCDPYLDES